MTTRKRPAELDDRERQGTSYIRYGDGTVHMRRGAVWCSQCGYMPEMMGTLDDGITPLCYPCKTKLLHPGGGPFAAGYRAPVDGYVPPSAMIDPNITYSGIVAGHDVDALRAANAAVKRAFAKAMNPREMWVLLLGYVLGVVAATFLSMHH